MIDIPIIIILIPLIVSVLLVANQLEQGKEQYPETEEACQESSEAS